MVFITGKVINKSAKCLFIDPWYLIKILLGKTNNLNAISEQCNKYDIRSKRFCQCSVKSVLFFFILLHLNTFKNVDF